jgi:hypothetical protein
MFPNNPFGTRAITSFNFLDPPNNLSMVDVIGTLELTTPYPTINLLFPVGTNLTSIIPTFTVSGDVLDLFYDFPEISITSGVTAINLAEPNTAAILQTFDGSGVRFYNLNIQTLDLSFLFIRFEPAYNPQLTSTIEGQIDFINRTVTFNFPLHVDIDNLIPTFALQGADFLTFDNEEFQIIVTTETALNITSPLSLRVSNIDFDFALWTLFIITPNDIKVTRNPIIEQVLPTTTSLPNQRGIYKINVIDNSFPSVTDSLIIENATRKYSYRASANPGRGEFFVGETTDETIENIYYMLLNDFNLITQYSITYMNNSVYLTTKYFDSIITPTFTGDNFFFETIQEFTTDFISSNLPDYSYVAELFISNSSDIPFGNFNADTLTILDEMTNITSLQTPVINNIGTFDLDKILDNYVDIKPPTVGNGFEKINNGLVAYFLSVGETYREENLTQKVKNFLFNTEIKYATEGRLPQDSLNSLSPYFEGVRFFTTNRPNNTYVRWNEPIVLSFIFEQDGENIPDNFTLLEKLIYIDGTDSGWSTSGTISNPTGGFYHVTYTPIEEEDIKNIELKIQVDEEDLTKVISFKVPEFPSLLNQTVYFKNRLGRFDSYTFVGNILEKTERESITTKAFVKQNYSKKDIILKTTNVELTPLITLNSGFVNEPTYRWLQEIIKSENIQLLMDNELVSFRLKNYKDDFDMRTGLTNIELTLERFDYE